LLTPRLLPHALLLAIGLTAIPAIAEAVPNGTWLSQPQLWFHASTQTLTQTMALIRTQHFKVVFLDYRNVPDALQHQIRQEARRQGLIPVVWIQSPEYRSLSIPQLIDEARHGDGLQIDDHFFANYSLADFFELRARYNKPIFCSIQPFQSALLPQNGCNQVDVQCYSSAGWQNCLKIAGQLGAVVSLSAKDTLGYLNQLEGQRFNVFLWPNSKQLIPP
jgi:hypothetical protein